MTVTGAGQTGGDSRPPRPPFPRPELFTFVLGNFKPAEKLERIEQHPQSLSRFVRAAAPRAPPAPVSVFRVSEMVLQAARSLTPCASACLPGTRTRGHSITAVT